MNIEYKFKQDQLVSFNIGSLSGTGYIKGVGTTPTAVLGAQYIVEVLETQPSIDHEVFPFTHVTISEVYITAKQE